MNRRSAARVRRTQLRSDETVKDVGVTAVESLIVSSDSGGNGTEARFKSKQASKLAVLPPSRV